MQLTKYSLDRMSDSFNHWHVEEDYSAPIINYLVHGFEPGSFLTSVLANDFFNAMCRSHPSNTVPALKDLSKWILNVAPRESIGSYEKVKSWLQLSDAQRRKILEECDLIFTEQEETWKVLNEPA